LFGVKLRAGNLARGSEKGRPKFEEVTGNFKAYSVVSRFIQMQINYSTGASRFNRCGVGSIMNQPNYGLFVLFSIYMDWVRLDEFQSQIN
jgi:hypothetical protein